MNWTTIYITGRSDFREDVRRKLERADLNFMPGYVDNSTARDAHDLFWLEENTDIRAFKEAIGSKLIWRYRLKFFTSLEDFIQSQNAHKYTETLTEEELNLIASMRTLHEKTH